MLGIAAMMLTMVMAKSNPNPRLDTGLDTAAMQGSLLSTRTHT